MDGGQILSAILGPKRQKAVYITGIVIAVILMIVAFKFLGIISALILGLLLYNNIQSLKRLK